MAEMGSKLPELVLQCQHRLVKEEGMEGKGNF